MSYKLLLMLIWMNRSYLSIAIYVACVTIAEIVDLLRLVHFFSKVVQ